jgi:UDP-glucose 4-epimerase
MNVLIIGCKGFIGSSCAHYFSKIHQVTGADISPDNHSNSYSYQRLTDNFSFDEILSSQSFDVCINASGSAHVAFSFENPATDFELNVLNVHRLLIAIRNHNPSCKIINFSSASVYGNPVLLPISENSPSNPLSPYGFHKLQSEYLMKEYHNFFGLKTSSLRIFSAYGPGLKKQLFWDLYQKAAHSDKIELFGSGNESRDYIYIDDLCTLIELVINQSKFKGETINAANGVEITNAYAAETFLSLLDFTGSLTFTGIERTGDPLNWKADINTIKEMGYSQKISFEAGLEKYKAWLREEK